MMITSVFSAMGAAFLILLSLPPALALAAPLTLQAAAQVALDRDAVAQRMARLALAQQESAVADAQLPDPALSVGLLNLPSDTFDTDQEPMNQFRIGLTQKFLPGDTLDLQRTQGNHQADGLLLQRQDRQLLVLRELRLAWLSALYWAGASEILAADQSRLEQLDRFTRASLGSGRSSLLNMNRVALEQTQLQDQQLSARWQQAEAGTQLQRWLGVEASRPLDQQPPDWILPAPSLQALKDETAPMPYLLAHPLVRALDRQTDALGDREAIAREAYHPAWGLDVGYAFRDSQNPDGSNRPDLFSVGVSVSLPLFAADRQDRRVRAATLATDAARDERLDLLRRLAAQVHSDLLSWHNIRARLQLQQTQTLPATEQLVAASFDAYQAGAVDLAEVLRTQLQLRNLKLEALRWTIDRLQQEARLAYLLPQEDASAQALIQAAQKSEED